MTKEGKLILELVRQFVDGKQGYPIEQTLYNWGEIYRYIKEMETK